MTQQTTSAGEDVEKGEPFCTISGNEGCCSHCGKQYAFIKKVKMELSYDPVNLLLGIYTKKPETLLERPHKIKNKSAFQSSNPTSGNISEETQNTTLKQYMHPYVHCSVIYNHQDVETAQVSANRWVDKTTMGHLHNVILLDHKKEESCTLCGSMDGSGEHYTKWN